jgi:hypothetical protein
MCKSMLVFAAEDLRDSADQFQPEPIHIYLCNLAKNVLRQPYTAEMKIEMLTAVFDAYEELVDEKTFA